LISSGWIVALLFLLAGATISRAQVALDPELARMPVIERIVSAPVFEEPLTWVGYEVPDLEESEALWAAIDLMREHGPQLGFEALEVFLEEYPGSVWMPSVRSNLGKRYRELGRYTLALEHWEQAWAETASARDPGGKRVADFTLAHWTRLLASLGRREQLALLLPGTFDRRLDGGPLQELFLATQEGFQRMVKEPEVAYRCGTLAVLGVGRALALPSVDLRTVLEAPSPESGFSLSMLGALSHDPNNEDDCEECPSSGGAGDGEDCDEDADCGTCDSKGLAVWKVSEPYLSLWVLDTPLYYTTNRGKRVAFTLNYRQRNSRPLTASWGMGPRWESSWLGYVRTDTYGGHVHLYPFHGGQRKYFAGAESSHYRSNSRTSMG
jgi:hypothetical protein